jgi:hypothetical protein
MERYPEEFVWPCDAGKKNWHTERLSEAEAAKDSFATAFHLRQLLQLDPGNAGWKSRLATVEDRLKVREPAPRPQPVK